MILELNRLLCFFRPLNNTLLRQLPRRRRRIGKNVDPEIASYQRHDDASASIHMRQSLSCR